MTLSRHFPVRNHSGEGRARFGRSTACRSRCSPGETLGIVGESGCGKSTLGKALAGIHPLERAAPSCSRASEISRPSRRERRAVAPSCNIVYQDPGTSLDPRWTIRRSLEEPLDRSYRAERRPTATGRIAKIMQQVGLPQTHLDLYPHELSGGQQRRVGLARILTLHPRLVVLDEPTSGLDVSVQATVLKLLRELQRAFSLTYLFISHDLSVVRMMCDRVAVMYLGRIVELAPTESIFAAAKHPYTQSLLAAIPDIGGRRVTDTFALEGEPPTRAVRRAGCRFAPRCPRAAARLRRDRPGASIDRAGKSAACVFA